MAVYFYIMKVHITYPHVIHILWLSEAFASPCWPGQWHNLPRPAQALNFIGAWQAWQGWWNLWNTSIRYMTYTHKSSQTIPNLGDLGDIWWTIMHTIMMEIGFTNQYPDALWCWNIYVHLGHLWGKCQYSTMEHLGYQHVSTYDFSNQHLFARFAHGKCSASMSSGPRRSPKAGIAFLPLVTCPATLRKEQLVSVAGENGHRNSELSHQKLQCSI